MRTIQMTLDEDLVQTVDEIVHALNTTRSAFTRNALREAIKGYIIRLEEEQHRRGYTQHPVQSDEFLIWEEEFDESLEAPPTVLFRSSRSPHARLPRAFREK